MSFHPKLRPAAPGDDVDLLPGALSDVADVEQPLLEVERPAPRVAQTVGPDLLQPHPDRRRTGCRPGSQRCHCRYRCGHRAEQGVRVLPVLERVATGPPSPSPSRDSRRDRRRARHRCGWSRAGRPRAATARCRRRPRPGRRRPGTRRGPSCPSCRCSRRRTARCRRSRGGRRDRAACSPPLSTGPDRSRKGSASTWLPSMILMAPPPAP